MRAPKDKSDWTPFDHWWDVYPGFRKKNKAVCREKFNKHSIDVQREIYTDTQNRTKVDPDWREPQYICAPEVYLNQQRWESPVAEAQLTLQPRSAAIDETPEQKARGIERLAKAALEVGEDDELLQQQLRTIKEYFGGHDE